MSAGRREQILRASTTLFGTHGYPATSLRQIAGAVGLSKGSIYHHFSCKEDILFAIALDFVQRTTACLQRSRADAASPLAVLDDFLRSSVAAAVEHPHLCAVMRSECSRLSGPRQAHLALLHRQHLTLLADAYRAGVDAGLLTPVDPMLAAATLLGAPAWLPRCTEDPGPGDPDAVCSQVADLLLGGYRARR